VRQYDIELLSAAPELSDIVPNSRETLTSMAIPAERTRFYARLRTLRIANGLVEFLNRTLCVKEPRSVIFEDVEHADRTDQEFLATALRRIDPARLTIVVCSGTADLAEETLSSALTSWAELIEIQPSETEAEADQETAFLAALHADELTVRARQYIWKDGTSDDPLLLCAYQATAPGDRAKLHDLRAAELARGGEFSLRLGAIPYHLAHGEDPAGAGARALQFALDYCVCSGFYWAAADHGQTGLGLVDPQRQKEFWWKFVLELGLAYSILSLTHEALELYDQARLLSIDPAVHMKTAYSTAMLYTRHNEPEERDEKKAKAWLNSAIATASLLPDPADRAFQSAFYRNGLALVEVNLGDLSEALRLVNECIDILDRELIPDEHRLHRSVLKNNRARVFNGLGRLDDALADYAVVIRDDPNHAEHYLEHGNILRRLGRYEEAFTDYETAARLSPPFPEIYYNRGDLRLAVGDREGALADFSYVLELDPGCVEAYVSRAAMLLEDGDADAAEEDVTSGLRYDAGNPQLRAALGQIHAAKGDFPAAIAAYDASLAADPALQAAWAGRAEAFFEMGDAAAAVASLDRALEISQSAALLFNRATALQSAGRWDEALADLEQAHELDPDDDDIAVLIRQSQAQHLQAHA